MSMQLLLASDHLLLRAGLRVVLEATGKIKIVGECGAGPASVKAARDLRPHVVLMLLGHVNDGLSAMRQIASELKSTRVVVIGADCDRSSISAILRHGAYGYLGEESTAEELLYGLTQVHLGHRYLTPDAAEVAVEDLVEQLTGTSTAPAWSILSRREREVLLRIGEGNTSSQVAREMHLSTHTVDTHRRNLMEKLGLHSLAGLIRFAIQHGSALAQPDRHCIAS